jgi:hypothetical protein
MMATSRTVGTPEPSISAPKRTNGATNQGCAGLTGEECPHWRTLGRSRWTSAPAISANVARTCAGRRNATAVHPPVPGPDVVPAATSFSNATFRNSQAVRGPPSKLFHY